MSIAIRIFVERLVNKIKTEGILSDGCSNSERENDVIDMIWEVYYENDKEK